MSTATTKIYSHFRRQACEGSKFLLPSRTQQHFKDECDINRILERMKVTGTAMQYPNGFEYGDFSDVSDYQGCLHRLIEADAAFATLPSKIRAEFNNDPAQLISFLQNPVNTDKAIELGLVVRNKVEPAAAESPAAVQPPAADVSASPKMAS